MTNTTATVTLANGSLTAASQLFIGGKGYDIPAVASTIDTDSREEPAARIAQAVASAGYRKVGLFHERVKDVVEFEVEPLSVPCSTCGYTPADVFYAETHVFGVCETSGVDYVSGYPKR